MKKPDTQVSALLVQKHQLEQSEHQLGDLDAALEALNALQTDTEASLVVNMMSYRKTTSSIRL